MKWLKSWERKLFPNDSLYQRSRRRCFILLGAVGLVILVWVVSPHHHKRLQPFAESKLEIERSGAAHAV